MLGWVLTINLDLILCISRSHIDSMGSDRNKFKLETPHRPVSAGCVLCMRNLGVCKIDKIDKAQLSYL